MLHLRPEQVALLDRESNKSLQLRLLARLREIAPQAFATNTESEILSTLDESIRVAARLGVRSDKALAQFASLAFFVGPGFWEIPAVRSFLSLEGMSTDQKIFLLTNRLRKREEAFPKTR